MLSKPHAMLLEFNGHQIVVVGQFEFCALPLRRENAEGEKKYLEFLIEHYRG